MQYIHHYSSPLGKIILAADEIGFSGLWFDGQKNSALYLEKEREEKALPIFDGAKHWLDVYFSGREPRFKFPLHFTGSDFQNEVWEILASLPYGHTATYGEIAGQIAKKRGLARISAQAVGGAVAKNKIAIIVPCHRVVGAGGNLTGYAGGLERKLALLKLEKVNTENFFAPKKEPRHPYAP